MAFARCLDTLVRASSSRSRAQWRRGASDSTATPGPAGPEPKAARGSSRARGRRWRGALPRPVCARAAPVAAARRSPRAPRPRRRGQRAQGPRTEAWSTECMKSYGIRAMRQHRHLPHRKWYHAPGALVVQLRAPPRSAGEFAGAGVARARPEPAELIRRAARRAARTQVARVPGRPPPAARRRAGTLFVGMRPTKGAPGCGGADARSTGIAEMRQAGFAPTTPASYN